MLKLLMSIILIIVGFAGVVFITYKGSKCKTVSECSNNTRMSLLLISAVLFVVGLILFST